VYVFEIGLRTTESGLPELRSSGTPAQSNYQTATFSDASAGARPTAQQQGPATGQTPATNSADSTSILDAWQSTESAPGYRSAMDRVFGEQVDPADEDLLSDGFDS
jgi:hypothetical protein